MDKHTDELIKAVATGGIIGALAATWRAASVQGESVRKKILSFVAGVSLSIVCSVILKDTTMAFMWKGMIIGACGAFGTQFYPILESGASKLLKKKMKDVGTTKLD